MNLQASATSRDAEDLLFFRMPLFGLEMFAGIDSVVTDFDLNKYPNKASYKGIHLGLIGTTKKLCYSQTGKLEAPDLKVG
ncbi:hypothetical protein YC2023_004496 [Brassica napus]